MSKLKEKLTLTFQGGNSIIKKMFSGFSRGFFILLIYECIEEALEEFIAFGIATISTKALSFFLVFAGTQLTKGTLKGIMVVLKSIIKKITYKDGNDKMEKLKEIATKLFSVLRANKFSIGETVVNGGVWGLLGYLSTLVDEVAIDVCGFNITPLFVIFGFVIVELGFQWESVEGFLARISPKLAKKLELKKAKEDALNEKKALAEKERLIAEMKAEKEAAIRAKEEEELAIKQAQIEAELAKQKEQEEKELAEWLAKKNAEKAKLAETTQTPPVV